MSKWKCNVLSIVYTIRWGLKEYFSQGSYLLGHDFQPTKEVIHDHFIMECSRCGERAGIDVDPNRVDTK